MSPVTTTLSCMQANLTQLRKARKFDCTCPREGLLAVPDEAHEIKCPVLRVDWSRSERLRHWLEKKIPVGGVTAYKGDDSQRPMTPGEHFAELETAPTIEVLVEDQQPFYIRLQRRVATQALKDGLLGRPLTWKHLGERLVTLLVEGAVKARRWLIWLAPFMAVAYIVFDIVRSS